MSRPDFTGERLHEGDALFSLDLARHQAAYEFARRRLPDGWALDVGCGAGYGAASLAGGGHRIVGADRVPPDLASRVPDAHYARADAERLPFAPGSFGLVLSFQVIEHLEDPTAYLEAIADALHPEGTALLTTPNRLTSTGVNPFHVHEYVADELAERLRGHFAEVEVRGVGATPAVQRTYDARNRRIRRIVRLDPLDLRRRLPLPWVERLFAAFAVLVRRRERGGDTGPTASWRDFPVGPADAACLDLLAVCRRPRRSPGQSAPQMARSASSPTSGV